MLKIGEFLSKTQMSATLIHVHSKCHQKMLKIVSQKKSIWDHPQTRGCLTVRLEHPRCFLRAFRDISRNFIFCNTFDSRWCHEKSVPSLEFRSQNRIATTNAFLHMFLLKEGRKFAFVPNEQTYSDISKFCAPTARFCSLLNRTQFPEQQYYS